MEVQVKAAQDNGKLELAEYNGRSYKRFIDSNGNTWKDYRIPYNAKDGPPEYDLTRKLAWKLEEHLDGIALTGWDWVNLKSRYVVFDFDDIANHAGGGLTHEQLKEVLDAVAQLPWVEIWRSTGGAGYHLKVEFKLCPTTENHRQHSAVAHAVLDLMSQITGCDLQGSVDCYGTTHWVWHRRAEGNDRAFDMVKLATEPLGEVPRHWKEFVTERTRKGVTGIPSWVPESEIDQWERTHATNNRNQLQHPHRKLMDWFRKNNKQAWWDRENWLFVCHTSDVVESHKALNLRGVFETVATGKEGYDHNCFMYPMPDGVWAVYRYGVNANEAQSWIRSTSGLMMTYLNQFPTFKDAMKFLGAARAHGSYTLTANQLKTLSTYYQVDVVIPWDDRNYKVKKQQGEVPAVFVKREADDEQPEGWSEHNRNKWLVSLDAQEPMRITGQAMGDSIRAVSTSSGIKFFKWDQIRRTWDSFSRQNCVDYCASLGMSDGDSKAYVGGLISNCWDLTSTPFAPEYPGGRIWNKERAQFSVRSSRDASGYFPTWDRMFNHIGKNLTSYVIDNPWCKQYSIKTGGELLKCWLSVVVQRPQQKLPYLFVYSYEQETGKSTFHEQIGTLFRSGVVEGNVAFAKSDFNAELEGRVLCFLEELNLGTNKGAYEKIKKLTAAGSLQIHRKGFTPYDSDNFLHFIHCANELDFAPLELGDKRCIVIKVNALSESEYVQKIDFEQRLRDEASDFLAYLLAIQLPRPYKRFFIPIISTFERESLLESRRPASEDFFADEMVKADGHKLDMAEVYERYQEWCMEKHFAAVARQKMHIQILQSFPMMNREAVFNATFKGDVNGVVATHKYTNNGTRIRKERIK